jgi:hypothetical protein
VNEVLRNPSVRNEIYGLIKELLTLREVNTIEDSLEKVLVDVLHIESIGKAVNESNIL